MKYLISIAAFLSRCSRTSSVQTVWCRALTSTGPSHDAECPPAPPKGTWRRRPPTRRSAESFRGLSPCFRPRCSIVRIHLRGQWRGCPRPQWSPWFCSSESQSLRPLSWTCSDGLWGRQPKNTELYHKGRRTQIWRHANSNKATHCSISIYHPLLYKVVIKQNNLYRLIPFKNCLW